MQSENAEEQMGCLRIKANECEYKEKGRRLKEKILMINDDNIMMEMIQELITFKKTN